MIKVIKIATLFSIGGQHVTAANDQSNQTPTEPPVIATAPAIEDTIPLPFKPLNECNFSLGECPTIQQI